MCVLNITELQPRKRSRTVLLGEELDQKVQTLINELRNKGGNVNLRIVRGWQKIFLQITDMGNLTCSRHATYLHIC
jgi:hypothetical protein